MTIKEKIKKEIDSLPDELLSEVQNYLDALKASADRRKKNRTLHLRGQYDDMNIRESAYE